MQFYRINMSDIFSVRQNTNSLIQEASLLDILMAEVGSIIEGIAEEV